MGTRAIVALVIGSAACNGDGALPGSADSAAFDILDASAWDSGGQWCSYNMGPVPAAYAHDLGVFLCTPPTLCGQYHSISRCCTVEELADPISTCALWYGTCASDVDCARIRPDVPSAHCCAIAWAPWGECLPPDVGCP